MKHELTETIIPTKNDVIVIGSGFAGLAAAIECKINGGNVIVLEKMKAIGGNSIISDGGIAAPDTPEQHLSGIIDSADKMFEDIMISAEGLNDPSITRIVCDHALEAYMWSKEELNVNYLPRVDIFGGHSVPRCYTPHPLSGSTMILKMKEKCEALGIKIYTGISVESFIKNDKDHVIGIMVDTNYSLDSKHNKITQQLMASQGIIVATGGFAADANFINKHNPNHTTTSQTTNKKTTSAEVLEACMDISAATINLDQIQWMPWSTNDETGYGNGGLFGDYIVSSYGILIDTKTGKRFVNELDNRKIVTNKILETINVIGIADAQAVEKAAWDLNIALKKGVIKSHPSLDHLSKHYEIPLDNLQNTINDYNQMVLDKHDITYEKTIESWMSPLETAPFYSMRINPKTHYSLGGLVIDGDTHVLDDHGQIIQGLYAAGEVTGLTHGANRLGSCSVTECLVMGRIAGKKVLETSDRQ
ncbi:MAG: flavocytochrome c [Erysipelotrichaceae bacterium]|nr:MAG: flavocytochrome [Erysipelotrichaceae bacterium]TXT17981.1 MAG: flavocytochrome c [Erysipelotrichaceae bacterium]